jgi:serine/threonine protein kinase
MPDSKPPTPARDSDEWAARESLFEAFEAAWQRGERPSIDAFLPRTDPVDHGLLFDLAQADMEWRLKAGEPARVEAYLARYPVLRESEVPLVEWIAQEFAWRSVREPGISAGEYLERFPQFAANLASLLRKPNEKLGLGAGTADAAGPTPSPHAAGADSEAVFPLPTVPKTFAFIGPPQAPTEIGRLGPYRVLGLLGSGGMGMVLRAIDPQLEREVALKVILPKYAADPRARQRFLREARASAAVDHVHVVPIFHVGDEHGLPFLVMPLLKGQTLAKALKQTPRLAIAEVARIGREIAEGLAAAHDMHLIHRDVKPGNIWLEGKKRSVRLLDFGLARPTANEPAGIEALTEPGVSVGTPAYMSPEQARGEAVTAASDLFSLGEVLYLMATGKAAFDGPMPAAILTALATKDPDPPSAIAPDMPPALSDLILRLLAKEPAERPPSATAVADELHEIEQGLAPEQGRTSAPSTIAAKPPSKKGSKWAWVAAGSLVLVGAPLLAFGVLRLLAPAEVRIVTPKGTLVIDSDDPNVEVVVRKNGALIRDRIKEREIVLEVGDYTIDLADKRDGLKLSTDRFSITHDGKETVRVRFEKKEPARVLSPEDHRRLAEWVLKQEGGEVRLEGAGRVRKAADLPQGPFQFWDLTIQLPNLQALPPEAAGWLRSLPAQTSVGILLTSREWDDDAFRKFIPILRDIPRAKIVLGQPCLISDQGLKHLAEVPNLWGIGLGGINVSDEGVRLLAALEHLEDIALNSVPVSDNTVESILAHGTFRSIRLQYTLASRACLTSVLKNANLEYLILVGLSLTDDDMQRLSALKRLHGLEVESAAVMSDGFRHLENVPDLWHLHIQNCGKVDDRVLQHLGKLKNLRELEFKTMKSITDQSLMRVKTLSKLETLALTECAVTRAGVARLRAELPKLRVEWDGDKKQP